MTVIYEAAADKPHHCTVADNNLPVGSICRCDCGRFWLRKTRIGDWSVSYWVPVRWYHRQARRQIAQWKEQRRIRPIVAELTRHPFVTCLDECTVDGMRFGCDVTTGPHGLHRNFQRDLYWGRPNTFTL